MNQRVLCFPIVVFFFKVKTRKLIHVRESTFSFAARKVDLPNLDLVGLFMCLYDDVNLTESHRVFGFLFRVVDLTSVARSIARIDARNT